MKISAIVPVYCEEKTVAIVVQKLLESPMIDEVICVDDASEDSSFRILQKFGRRIGLIRHKKNKGKGAALVSGIKKAKGEIVAFFDADLLTLTEGHIQDLLNPLLRGMVRSTMGYGSVNIKAFASWTGERTYFKEDLLPHLKEIEASRFGVEMYLNHNFKDTKLIKLKGLTGFYKNRKFPPSRVVNEYLKEALEIARTKSRLYGTSLPKDFSTLKNFKNLEDFRLKLSKITDKELRRFIKEYILKYIQL